MGKLQQLDIIPGNIYRQERVIEKFGVFIDLKKLAIGQHAADMEAIRVCAECGAVFRVAHMGGSVIGKPLENCWNVAVAIPQAQRPKRFELGISAKFHAYPVACQFQL